MSSGLHFGAELHDVWSEEAVAANYDYQADIVLRAEVGKGFAGVSGEVVAPCAKQGSIVGCSGHYGWERGIVCSGTG